MRNDGCTFSVFHRFFLRFPVSFRRFGAEGRFSFSAAGFALSLFMHDRFPDDGLLRAHLADAVLSVETRAVVKGSALKCLAALLRHVDGRISSTWRMMGLYGSLAPLESDFDSLWRRLLSRDALSPRVQVHSAFICEQLPLFSVFFLTFDKIRADRER